MKRTAKHLRKRPANIDWMMDVLATINENHEYFRKDYYKPKKLVAEDELVADDQLIKNTDGFFDSLPIAKNVKKKYRLNLNGPSKVDKERKKLYKMQKAAEKLQQQLVQQQENIRMAEEQEVESSDDEVLSQARQGPRPARTVINHGNDEEEKGGDQPMVNQELSSSSSEENYLPNNLSQELSGSPNVIGNAHELEDSPD
jgi:hypothetical protein